MAEILTATPGSTSVALEPTASPSLPGFAIDEPGLFAGVYPLPRLELVSGRGAWVKDASGREYLDFVSGIAVNAFGHTPPGLGRAVAKQMRTLSHASNLFANRPAIELAKALTEATGYSHVFLCNSGTEAIEAALKFARAARGARPGTDVLAFRGGFHGRTAWALATTWNPHYREPFEPLVPGVRFADYNDVAGLDDVLDSQVSTVIVEPVQGEGGAIPATSDFLRALRARTSALGVTLIFDEIQCGMGRSGRLLAAEHHGVQADLTVLSKALGAGFPLGAVLMTAEIAATLRPGMHGCTFGGNAAAAAAGLWVLGQMKRRSFLPAVRRRAKRLARGLDGLVTKHPSLAQTRGLGLLRAIEISPTASYGPPDLVAGARDEGLLLVRGGERAVRVLPPLDVKDADLDEAVARLDRAVTKLEAEAPKEGDRK